MLQATQIIKRPLITEKGTWESQARNRYSFWVDMRADKAQIKAAIGQIYGVRVKKVRTLIRKGKVYRNRYGYFDTGDWKKAIVELYPEDKIDLF